MKIITRKIKAILESKKLSINKTATILMKEKNAGNLNKMISGKKKFPESYIERLLPIIEVSKKEFDSWVLASKYEIEVFEKAIDAKKNITESTASVLSKNIDKLLTEHKITRNALGTKINYDPGSVRKMIIGEMTISKTVIKGIAPVLEISENDIQSWILADTYSLKNLEDALKSFTE